MIGLDYDYRTLGPEELKKRVIDVDRDCGANFRAVKYMEPYVIYAITRRSDNVCNAFAGPVAILLAGDRKPQRGEYIDANATYRFLGILDGKGGDGFPIKIPLLKQVKIKPKDGE